MILQRIVLHNFGPYLGRHEIDLSLSPRKPVILFGGMNGGGKTSLLTAIQLVLYGRQANVWRGLETSYDAYLRRSIHRRADPDEGAGIELTFTTSLDGQEQDLHLCRYWRVAGASLRESLDVIRDGELDTVLAEHWAEWVEEVIPARVAPLFFFDGEKVEQMADPGQSAEILRSAVQSLLGLDIVDQLQEDLEILERRKRKELDETQANSKLLAREKELAHSVEVQTKHVATATQDIASTRNEVERLEKSLGDVEVRLEQQGGQLFEQRHELEEERARQLDRAKKLEDDLRDLAAGALPLLGVADRLREIETAAQGQRDSALQGALLETLQERDATLLARLADLRAAKSVVASVEAFLQQDREARGSAGSTGPSLLEHSGLARCHAVLTHVLPSETARANGLLRQLDEVELAIQNLDRKLAGLPDEEQIRPLLQERDQLRAGRADASRRGEALQESLRLHKLELERTTKALEAARLEMTEGMLDNEDLQRLLQHSLKARQTLARFRDRVLAGHVQRIEKLAHECFTTLMRKQNLVRDLRIDPNTFEVTLWGEHGESIPPHKLSAGERQLLAIGLLWGLARASGRPLPTVIDTPLGRLDSSHRTNLIRSYFPIASHQVILLSTDEEVDERYHKELLPSISRTYLLEFDDKRQETHVVEGYFWEVA